MSIPNFEIVIEPEAGLDFVAEEGVHPIDDHPNDNCANGSGKCTNPPACGLEGTCLARGSSELQSNEACFPVALKACALTCNVEGMTVEPPEKL